jgi:hypothetical protein
MVDVDGAPAPGVLVGEIDEPTYQAAPGLDGVDREATGQHLRSPTVEHRF